jgi:hypothetical protein
MVPVELFNISPGGSDPTVIEKVYGGTPPLAATEEEYGTPAWPALAAQASVTPGGVLTGRENA